MDNHPETTTDSPPKRFQFTIVSFFEATVAVSIFLAIFSYAGLDWCLVVLGFFVSKALITLVGIKHRAFGVILYIGLWVLFFGLTQIGVQLVWSELVVFIAIAPLLPSYFFTIDLNRGFVRPRALIWRPFAEIFAFFAVAIFVPAVH